MQQVIRNPNDTVSATQFLRHFPNDRALTDQAASRFIESVESASCMISNEKSPQSAACLSAATTNLAATAAVGTACSWCAVLIASTIVSGGALSPGAIGTCGGCFAAGTTSYMTSNNMELMCRDFVNSEEQEN